MNYGKGRLGVTASGGGHYGWPQTGSTLSLRETQNDLGITELNQYGTSRSSRLGFRTNAGFEYNVNAFSSINGAVSYRGHHTDNLNDIHSIYTEDSNILLEEYQRESDSKSNRERDKPRPFRRARASI